MELPVSRCKTPPSRAGLQILLEMERGDLMILLALLFILVLRKRRTKLKIELDL